MAEAPSTLGQDFHGEGDEHVRFEAADTFDHYCRYALGAESLTGRAATASWLLPGVGEKCFQVFLSHDLALATTYLPE